MTPYPLAWPENMARFKGGRQPGAFKTTLAGAMTNVKDSLRRFGADSDKPVTEVVISSNVTLGENNPADPGVAIWFKWDGLSVCIPVDRYSKVEANLQAIHHIIEARRTELRHGTLALVRATFTGFAALPLPGKRSWRAVLGIAEGTQVTKSVIETFYRDAARRAHPDAGGTNDQMAQLNTARDAALKEIG
jgi:hypothetical protein